MEKFIATLVLMGFTSKPLYKNVISSHKLVSYNIEVLIMLHIDLVVVIIEIGTETQTTKTSSNEALHIINKHINTQNKKEIN